MHMAPFFGFVFLKELWFREDGSQGGSVHPGFSGRKGLQPLRRIWNRGPQAAQAVLVLADSANWSMPC